MLNRIMDWVWKRKEINIEKALFPTKRVKIEGIIFVIRKINPLDYLAGFRVLQQTFDTYDQKSSADKQLSETVNVDKIRAHYTDVLTAAVIEPKLTRQKEETGLWVDALFNSWEICEKLYNEILIFTHGKKKLKSLGYLKRN